MAGAASTDLTTRIANTDTALSLGGVAVVGAGLSISSRFPATRGLTSLLWNSLDSDAATRSDLATTLGRDDAEAKWLSVVRGESVQRVVDVWGLVALL